MLRSERHPVNCFIVLAADANNIPDEITVNSKCPEYLARLSPTKWKTLFKAAATQRACVCISLMWVRFLRARDAFPQRKGGRGLKTSGKLAPSC